MSTFARMFDTSVLCTALLLISATRIIFSNPVPENFTTESQNAQGCGTSDKWAECVSFLEDYLNQEPEGYRQLQKLKNPYNLHIYLLPTQAAMRGYTELTDAMLINGLPVNKKYSVLKETMLHMAAQRGRDNLVALLLARGADIEVKDFFGNTPLHRTASHQMASTVQLLLDSGADVNVTNKLGETSLFRAIKYFSPVDLIYGDYKVERYDTLNNIIKLLLNYGADANIPNNQAETPLHAATKHGNLTIIKLLLDGGADINATDENNQTPLHIATESNNLSVVEYLVELGCDKSITKIERKTALDIAKEKNFTKIAHLLSR